MRRSGGIGVPSASDMRRLLREAINCLSALTRIVGWARELREGGPGSGIPGHHTDHPKEGDGHDDEHDASMDDFDKYGNGAEDKLSATSKAVPIARVSVEDGNEILKSLIGRMRTAHGKTIVITPMSIGHLEDHDPRDADERRRVAPWLVETLRHPTKDSYDDIYWGQRTRNLVGRFREPGSTHEEILEAPVRVPGKGDMRLDSWYTLEGGEAELIKNQTQAAKRVADADKGKGTI